jgi:hypothetical protein
MQQILVTALTNRVAFIARIDVTTMNEKEGRPLGKPLAK